MNYFDALKVNNYKTRHLNYTIVYKMCYFLKYAWRLVYECTTTYEPRKNYYYFWYNFTAWAYLHKKLPMCAFHTFFKIDSN